MCSDRPTFQAVNELLPVSQEDNLTKVGSNRREQPCTGPRNDWRSSAPVQLRAAGHKMPTATNKLHPWWGRWSLKLKVVSMCSVGGTSLLSWQGCVHVTWLTAQFVSVLTTLPESMAWMGQGPQLLLWSRSELGHISWEVLAAGAEGPVWAGAARGCTRTYSCKRCLRPSHTCGLQVKWNLFHKYHMW